MKHETVISIHGLPYTASDGKTYRRDFTDDHGLYIIAQNLRVTKARPQLKAIQDFLAKASVFADSARLDPESAEVAISASRREKYLRQGRDDEWVNLREFSIVTRKAFTAMLYELLGDIAPYGRATNTVYEGVFSDDAKGLRKRLGLTPQQSPRDHLGRLQLAYLTAAEEACRIALARYADDDALPIELVLNLIAQIAQATGLQAQQMADLLGIDLVTGQPILPRQDNQ